MSFEFEPFAQRRETRRNVQASKPNPQTIFRHRAELRPVDARRQEKNAGFLDKPAVEADTLASVRALLTTEPPA
jgi:hypothetical protein